MSCGGGGEIVTYQWVDCDRSTVSKRYDRIAQLIPFFDRLFFLPNDLRRKAAMRLGLSRGDSVLDIGCGTGVNFPYLRDAVGPTGRIYGVDISPGMLRKAKARRDTHGLTGSLPGDDAARRAWAELVTREIAASVRGSRADITDGRDDLPS